MRCPICDIEKPTWPTVDTATGWTFCGSCYSAAQAVQRNSDLLEPFAEWLRAIALCREARWYDGGGVASLASPMAST